MSRNNSSPELPSTFETVVKAMISGFINALPASVSSLNINGTAMTPTQIKSQLDSIEVTLSAVGSTRMAYSEAVAARQAAMPSDKTFVAGVVSALKGYFGASPTQLDLFGIVPPKVRAKLTIEQAAIAKAKSKATRALRGTMGKKQRAAITLEGQSTLQVIGPTGQPLAPSASSGPSSTPAPVPPAAPAAPAAPATVAPTTAGH